MGLSVANQVNKDKMFSISTISKDKMREFGIKLTLKELQTLARQSPPHIVIYTGDDHSSGKRRQVNIYRYEDFIGK